MHPRGTMQVFEGRTILQVLSTVIPALCTSAEWVEITKTPPRQKSPPRLVKLFNTKKSYNQSGYSLKHPSHIFPSSPLVSDISNGIIDQLHTIFCTMDIYLQLLNQITYIKILHSTSASPAFPFDFSLEKQFSILWLKLSWR